MTNKNAVDALVEILNEAANEVCEKICKYHEKELEADELIDKYCEECPLGRITY